MSQLVRNGEVSTQIDLLDRRKKLVRVADVEELKRISEAPHRRPRPRTIGAIEIDVRSDEIDEWIEAKWRLAPLSTR
jgi:hypothetical protein